MERVFPPGTLPCLIVGRGSFSNSWNFCFLVSLNYETQLAKYKHAKNETKETWNSRNMPGRPNNEVKPLTITLSAKKKFAPIPYFKAKCLKFFNVILF